MLARERLHFAPDPAIPLRVTVIIAGIVDPKWTAAALPPVAGCSRDGTPLGESAQTALINCELSPFDRAALECALQLRDVGTEVTITVLVAAGAGAVEGLMRTVAAYRPDHLLGREISAAELWDAQATASRLAKALDAAPAAPDFVLIGREFGDYDDGAVAPCLAETLAWPFVGLIHEIRMQQSACDFVRQRGEIEEQVAVAGPVIASVTNAACNRLRHPLLKNVMAAKRARFEAARCGAPAATAREMIAVSPAAASSRRTAPCRLIGGSTEQQAAVLVNFLQALGAA